MNNLPLTDDLESPVPIIWLWDSMLVPLQGELSDAQAASLTDDILGGIRGRGCAALIIDASGLWLVDSHLCAVLADIAHSASLMGTRTILSGLRAEVALTLLTMDVMLEGVDTVLNLEQALLSIGIGPSGRGDDNDNDDNDDDALTETGSGFAPALRAQRHPAEHNDTPHEDTP